MGNNAKTRGYLSIIGGIIIHLTLGTFYTFGNMNVYLSSYIASKHGGQDDYNKYYSDCVWIYTTMGMAQALSLPLGGKAEHYLGPKLTAFIGSLIMSIGVFLTYFTCSNLYLSITTYGFIKGFGLGFAYTTPLVVGMRWFPEHKGTVNGCIIFGFGAASTIFDLVQTQFINPNNVKQDSKYAFTNKTDVLNNIPSTFIKLSIIYLAMQIIGSLMLSNPTDFVYPSKNNSVDSQVENKKEKEKEDPTKKLLNEEEDKLQLKVNENDDETQEMIKKETVDLTEKEVLMDWKFWNLWMTFCLV